jgi:predicted molibdopterin-dependent oxidoreductase YjgC
LKDPLVRKNGELVQTTWEEALKTIKEKFSQISAKYGSKAIAGLSSAKCTNEENFLFQKLMRSVFRTNNIDHCARL